MPAATNGHHIELARLASESLMREAGFEAAPIAQLVVDHEGKLALANLQARMLFSLTRNDIGKPIQDLELSYRPVELRSRIEQAYNEKHTLSLRDIEWRVGETDPPYVDVQVVSLISTTGQVLGCAVTFTDATQYQRPQQALTESKRDAQPAYEELQSTVEERWNEQASEQRELIEDEVRGTHFLNLDTGLPADDLRGPIRDVANGRSQDSVVQLAAINRRGRPVDVKVQLWPLTRGNDVDGVILVMEADPAVTKA